MNIENDNSSDYNSTDVKSINMHNNEDNDPFSNSNIPFLGKKSDLKENEELEFSNYAYKLFYRLSVQEPSLSIDFVSNFDFNNILEYKEIEPNFPLTLYAASGTQTEIQKNNKLYCYSFSNLEITQFDDEDSICESESEAIINAKYIPLNSGINRIKTMKNTSICATWNEDYTLKIFDLSCPFNDLSNISNNKSNISKYSDYKKCILGDFYMDNEGFALDFSDLVLGKLSTGDLNGNISIFEGRQDKSFILNSVYNIFSNKSVEDVRFSPNQDFVIGAVSIDGTLKILDTRSPTNNPQFITFQVSNTDINVMSWNKKACNLIVCGDDNGAIKVFDLRFPGKDPISHINWHSNPITSIDWNPHDEWTLAASSEDNRVSIWDLSVEKEDTNDMNIKSVPDQMMFLHMGQSEIKEIKWNNYYKNMLISTANDGINIFIPNIDEDEEPNNKMEIEN